MNMRMRFLRPLVGLAILGVCGQASAAGEPAIPSKWKLQEIAYDYVGYTTVYDCDTVEDKLKAILEALGAHENTRVRISGCPGSRPMSRRFFVQVTVATPVPAADANEASTDQSRQHELLMRLEEDDGLLDEEFLAHWKSIELSKDRRLDIQPGDCELMESLHREVLPKLGVKTEEKRIVCMSNHVSLQRPQLRVSALIPLRTPDAKKGE